MYNLVNIFHAKLLGCAHCVKDYSISVYQARYTTYVVAKYLDTATVKSSKNFDKTTFPYDMIFTKADASTSDENFENFTREFNIHYRACIGSLIYVFSKRVDLIFVVHKLSKISSNPGIVHFEVLVRLLGYIRDNNTLGLKYYANINDAPLYDLLRQVRIKTENRFMVFSDSSWQDCPDTDRSIGAYIIFYQGG